MQPSALLVSATVFTLASGLAAQTSFDYDRTAAPAIAAPGILTEGFPVAPVMALSAFAMGLIGADEIDALSFGDDQVIGAQHALIFSVDPFTVGAPGSGTEREFIVDTAPGAPPAAAGDIFIQEGTGVYGNLLAPPTLGFGAGTTTGDESNATWGAPCGGANGCFDLDAFDYTPPAFATGVYFSLRPGSPTLGAIGAGPGDILYSDLGGAAPVIAMLAGGGPASAGNLGIQGMNLDALNLLGSTGPVGAGGGVIFPGPVGPSATGGAVPFSTHFLEYSVSFSGAAIDADVLVRVGAGAFAIHTPAFAIGLAPWENLNALEATPPLNSACPPLPATLSHYNGMGINLDTLSAGKVIIGAPWTATISPQATRGAGGWIVLMRTAPVVGPVLDLGPLFGLPPAGLSQLLVGGGSIGSFPGPPHGGGGTSTTLSVAVPFNCALLGLNWASQAIVTGDLPPGGGVGLGLIDPWLSSAATGSIGIY